LIEFGKGNCTKSCEANFILSHIDLSVLPAKMKIKVVPVSSELFDSDEFQVFNVCKKHIYEPIPLIFKDLYVYN
jgi:hypothetical protein